MPLPIHHLVQMCRCSFHVHVLVLPRAALRGQHRATMHSLEIHEGKLVSPFGVLGMPVPTGAEYDAVPTNWSVTRMGVAPGHSGAQVGRWKWLAGGRDSKKLWERVEKSKAQVRRPSPRDARGRRRKRHRQPPALRIFLDPSGPSKHTIRAISHDLLRKQGRTRCRSSETGRSAGQRLQHSH